MTPIKMKPKTQKLASKARKTRFRRCFYCEKRFKNPQAVRAHQLHCSVRRLKKQAQTAIKPQPPQARPPTASRPNGSIDELRRRPGPDSKENKRLLVDSLEQVQLVKETARNHAVWAWIIARKIASHAKGCTKPEEWFQIYQDLDDIERDMGQMFAALRLDRAALFRIYHQWRSVMDRWLQYQTQDWSDDRGELKAEGQVALQNDETLLNEVLSKIKDLLVAAR